MQLRSTFLVAWIPGVVLAQSAPQGPSPRQELAAAPQAMQSITAAELEEFARTFASDEFGGRLTGTPGQRKAAQLFADRFERLGLTPLGDENEGGERSWFQAYRIRLESLDAEKTGLFDGRGAKLHQHGAWFLPRRPDTFEVKGGLVFARSDAIGDVNLKGKIAVMPLDLGGSRPGNVYQAMSAGFRLAGLVRSHARQALGGEAAGCVLVAPELPASFLSMANMFAIYPGKPRVTRPGRGRGITQLGSSGPKLPTLVLGGKDAERVLERLHVSSEQAFDELDETAAGKKSAEDCVLRAVRRREEAKALNTCAYLAGSDPALKSEAIVYSCHMDHLGHAADGGFFYGADDNASGSATVLEIAEAYSRLPERARPRRSVIFLAVSGEELGLWGSAHFVRNPTWPLGDIVADINMDMLGRSTRRVPEDTVAMTPTHKHAAYSTLARDAAWLGKAFDLAMGNGDRFYARSDHYNFARRGIPVVFFVDDEHADYHMPSDTWQKLEFPKMERIARLAFLLGYRTANADARPQRLGKRASWFSENGSK